MIRRMLVAAILLCMPIVVSAQLPIPSLALVGGVSNWSLGSSGSSAFGALRVSVPLLTLVGEGSLGAFRANDVGGTSTYVIPEAQLQYQFLPTIVRPYLGVGGGWFKAVTGPDPHRNDITISGSAGVRVSLPLIPIGLQAEARVRSVHNGGHAIELTVGGHF